MGPVALKHLESPSAPLVAGPDDKPHVVPRIIRNDSDSAYFLDPAQFLTQNFFHGVFDGLPPWIVGQA